MQHSLLKFPIVLIALNFCCWEGDVMGAVSPSAHSTSPTPRKPLKPGDVVDLPPGSSVELPNGLGIFTPTATGKVRIGQNGSFTLVAGPGGATTDIPFAGVITYLPNSENEVTSPLGGGRIRIPGRPVIDLPKFSPK